MQPKLLKTEHAGYVPQTWSGANTSGWRPFGDAVLVLPDVASETMGDKGLIHLPKDLQDRNSLASESGILIATGEGTFSKVAETERPKPGERVLFARYSGRRFMGKDGAVYLCMTDDCIGAAEIADG
jgi:co-chaperonin GroES (HSP10)